MDMVEELREHLQTLALDAVFDFNDHITRSELKRNFEQHLDEVKLESEHLRFAKRTYPDNERNLFDYCVVCDETNNTPEIIDRNELKIDVAVKPSRKVEYIFLPITVVAA